MKPSVDSPAMVDAGRSRPPQMGGEQSFKDLLSAGGYANPMIVDPDPAIGAKSEAL